MSKDIKVLMAYYIHALRIMRGYTQKDVADRLNKSTNAVSNWELGNTSPPIDDLVELCKMFDVTPNQICGWEECSDLTEFIQNSKNADQVLDVLIERRNTIDEEIKKYTKLRNHKP